MIPSAPCRNREVTGLDQAQAPGCALQFFEVPLWNGGMPPGQGIPQPTEEHVEARRSKCQPKACRWALGPAGPVVLLLTFLHRDLRPPLRQAGEIDLAGGERCRFPVDRIDETAAVEHVLGIILAMD